MTVLLATRLDGAEAALPMGTVRDFKSALRGKLLLPDEEGYEVARNIWNGMIDKRPGLIARCAGVADVVRSVNFARENELLVAVCGGGHDVAGNAMCDGGLVIDLRQMKSVRVDPARRVARAEPGLTLADFDFETQVFELATTSGIVSTTGLAGLTLGGGLGWLVRKYGLTCDNLLAVDIVTADGQLQTACATENEDLFWAVRGGGANFGVVTSFEYQLHPVGEVLGGMVTHPYDKARDVLQFHREFVRTAPDEITAHVCILTCPDGLPVVAIVVCYCGQRGLGEEVVRPIRDFGSPLVDLIRPRPYVEMQSILDGAFPAGMRYYWKAQFLRELSDEAIDVLLKHTAGVTSPRTAVVLEYYGGAASRVSESETAFPHRCAEYNLLILTQWEDANEDDHHIGWARTFWEDMQPFSSGRVHVNSLGVEGDDRVRASFGVNYDRLAAIKRARDPTNLFRVNQNIRPAQLTV